MAGKKILFVDDEANIRITLPMILKREGYDVTPAASVPEALELIGKEAFDILISDLNIGQPGDGFTVVSAMRRIQPDAVTYILTGYPDFDTALQAIRSQVDDYVTKPANIPMLIQSLKHRLNSPPPRHRPLATTRLSALIQGNQERIIEGWLKKVQQDPGLSAIDLPRKSRVDHIPVILEELTYALDAQEGYQARPESLAAAAKHGGVRRKQGYSIPQIIAEARLLQEAISDFFQENLLRIDVSCIIEDAFAISVSLQTQLEASVSAYLQESEVAA